MKKWEERTGDGLQDLVFGTNRACIRFFSSLPLDKRLWEEWYATPCVTDLDRDGRPDLLIGAENGKVYFFDHDEIVPSGACSSGEI